MSSRASLRTLAWSGLISLVFFGCSDVSKNAEEDSVEIELRNFTIKEEEEEGAVGDKWNSFSGSGTITTRDPRFQKKTAFLVLQIVDKTEGDSSEPAMQFVLLRDGLGKVETYKGDYGKIARRPEYKWAVLGWIMLDGPGKLTVLK